MNVYTFCMIIEHVEEKGGDLTMKIAIVSPGSFSVPPVIGTSVEHVIYQVAKQLKHENQVVVYTRKCSEYPTSSQEGNLLFKRFRYRNSNQYLKRVIKHIEKTNPDVIHVENRPAYVLQIKKTFPNIPIILNMQSDVFSSEPYINKSDMVEVSQLVDALITNSKALEKTLVKKFPAFQGKSNPIHLGIDLAPYNEARKNQQVISSLREKYGLGSGETTILFAGRLLKKKGVHLILDIMPRLLKEFPQLKLMITGSTKYGKNQNTKYVQKIKRMTDEIKDHVVFTDFVSPDMMPYIYQLADIVVTPSIWNEPFLLVNLEAMSSKKPVVTTKKGGIPEVVIHGESGFVFAAENYGQELFRYLSLLLKSKQLSDEVSNQGWERAKEFSWNRTATGYFKVFEELVKK